jgi:O-antigen/teichoic acid export membrane protein
VNSIKTILKNTLALSIANVSTKAITAVVSVLLARYLGAKEFGEYSVAIAFATVFVALTDLGFGQIIVREGSRKADSISAHLSNAFWVRIALSFLSFFLMLAIGSRLESYQDIIGLLVILGLYVFIGDFQNTFFRVLQASQEMIYIAIFQLARSFLIGITVISLIQLDASLLTIAWDLTLVVLAVTVSVALFVFRRYEIVLKTKNLFRMFKEAFPFGLATMLFLVYLQIPTIILSVMKDKTEVGLFSAAFKLIVALYFIPQIISSVVYPILFRLGAEDLERHKKTYAMLFRFLGSFGLPVSMALFLLAKPIVYFLFGPGFIGTVDILKVLCWLLALQCMSYPLADALTTADFQRHRTFMHGLAAGLCTILCLLLIPRHGAFGAGLALLFTELITVCGYQFLTWRHLKGNILFFENSVAILATLIMGMTILVLISFLNLFVVLILGTLIYLVALLTLDRQLAREFGVIIKSLREQKSR